MKTQFLLFVFVFISLLSSAQLKQNFRGTITDQTSKFPLPGANISLTNGDESFGTTSNASGVFEVKNLPLGRYQLTVSFMGYETFLQKNIDLESGKEKVMNVEMIEKVENLDEIIVSASGKGEVRNEMAALSARSFSVAETEKYAGSWGDPSRMASNFAGVITANDSRNDIIIRGNSSLGLLWKLDGVSIPNPNHFGALGTTGGPVSMLNNNVLTNSDFFTGAFPAEYGNALSGVFDLKMRNGNNQKHEFVGQIGFSGFELGAEGPLSSNKNASYIINYRYSVLDVMSKLGFDIGSGVPEYQDLTMKLYLPTKKMGTFSFYAIGGKSRIIFEDSGEEGGTSYDTGNDTRTVNRSEMGVVALSHRFFPDSKSNIFTSVSLSGQGVDTEIDSTGNDLPDIRYYGEGNDEVRTTFSTRYTRKFDSRNSLKAGASFESYTIDYADSVDGREYDQPFGVYVKGINTHESGLILLQSFAEFQHKLNQRLTFYGGAHFQHFFYNSTSAIDPRLSITYQLLPSSKVALAYGMHSQIQPLYIYFVEDYDKNTGTYTQTNNDLKFSKAQHIVASYDQMVCRNMKLKIETYYQHLTSIPVDKDPSPFSMVNEGNKFHQQRAANLLNNGLGRNYGAEITLEKYLSDNYYFLATTSIFDSKYKGSDNIWHNTEFNSNYVVNALGGYQIPINHTMSIDLNLRVVWAGGKRNPYIDLEKSILKGEAVYDNSKTYSQREKNYFKLDGRISFKKNGKKSTQEWALDVTNMTNHHNVYSRYYDDPSKSIKYVYQQLLYPMMLYRINF